jgi:DNA-directed RNA polymerase subunit omega
MAKVRLNLMDPPIEDLLDKVDSKFTLVALGALRARQVNAYYNSLGEGLGRVVPPQVPSVSGKPLSIAFEEIAASKATYVRIDPDELVEGDEGEAAEGAAAFGEADVEALAPELLAVEGSLESGAEDEVSAEPAEEEGPAAG